MREEIEADGVSKVFEKNEIEAITEKLLDAVEKALKNRGE